MQITKTKKKDTRPKKSRVIYPFMINPEDTDENPLTWKRLVDWLAATNYIEGFIFKRISPLDMPFIEDYIQEVWVQILQVPQDKFLGLWYKGKGKFTNYLKSIVINNIRSNSSNLYKNIRLDDVNKIHLDDEGWNHLIDGKSADAYLQYTLFFDKKPETNYERIEVRSDINLEETQREIDSDNYQ